MSRPRVMLVASIQDDREMYAEYLQVSGCTVVEVDRTAEALARAEEVDVIVTDVGVEALTDGLELIRQLRRHHSTMEKPIIVLTAYTFDRDRQRARESGCDTFLSKPCLPPVLLKEIRRVVGLRSPHAHDGRATVSLKRRAR